jgi:hypothetical protein
VAAWPLDDPVRVTAAATLVTGLTDGGHPHTAVSWISAEVLRSWATHPERVPSTSGYATIARAYLLAGGRYDQEMQEAVRRGIDQRRGCPHLASLYQTDGTEPVCDLKSTWAVWKLKLLTDHRLPGSGSAAASPTRR